jgi:adenylosuccinate synthase
MNESKNFVDVVVGLSYGDEGKGKITHHLCRENDYTHVIRFNGGCNAGHTIFHEGKKFVTHHIPSGVFFGVKSIIGPGCVVNPTQFFQELLLLKQNGIDIDNKIFIAKNAHVITDMHLQEEKEERVIGTTKRGNGPAYRDKYSRMGTRAEDEPSLREYLVDMYEEVHESGPARILCEGAQAFGLDIDWGNYPYVTSSHCTTAGALLNGIPHSWIRNVYGVAKVYDTYVGQKSFEPDAPVFELLRQKGEEYGATTGRPRQCNWLDINLVKRAVNINGVNNIIFNKCDVLREVGKWNLLCGDEGSDSDETLSFDTEPEFKQFIRNYFSDIDVTFSEHKDRI